MIPKRVKKFYINVVDKMTGKDYDYTKEILNSNLNIIYISLNNIRLYGYKS